jgi:hypothetical protein
MIPLDALLLYHNSSQTDFQLDRFVTIRSGGTPYGCFFQALREMFKRFRGIRADYLARRKLHVRLKRYQQLAAGTDYRAELAAIRIDETLEALEYTEKQIRTDEREFLRTYSQAASLFMHLGFDREAPNPKRLEQLERERWEHHALCAVAQAHINGQAPGNIISIIQSMPCAMRADVLRRCFGNENSTSRRASQLDRLANWYLNYVPELPEPLVLSESESQEVLRCCASPRSLRLSLSSSPTAAVLSVESSIPSDSESAKPAHFASD